MRGEVGASALDDRGRLKAVSCVEAALSRKTGHVSRAFWEKSCCGESRQGSAASPDSFGPGRLNPEWLPSEFGSHAHLSSPSFSAQAPESSARPSLRRLPSSPPDLSFSGVASRWGALLSRVFPPTALTRCQATLLSSKESLSARTMLGRACASFFRPAFTRPFRWTAREPRTPLTWSFAECRAPLSGRLAFTAPKGLP